MNQKLVNTIALIFMLVMNAIAVILPLAGKTTGELSDSYENLFVPAGFTFSIWGIIYMLLIGFVAYQWIGKSDDSKIDKIGNWFWINGLLNGLWICAWHYEFIYVSIIIMLGLLFSLIKMYVNANVCYFKASPTQWFVHVPISVYLGWISVATIANSTAVLVVLGYNGNPLGADAWAAGVLLVAVFLGGLFMKKYNDIFYAAVVAWASYGILSKRIADTMAMDAKIQHTAQIALYLMIIGITLTIVLAVVKKNKSII